MLAHVEQRTMALYSLPGAALQALLAARPTFADRLVLKDLERGIVEVGILRSRSENLWITGTI